MSTPVPTPSNAPSTSSGLAPNLAGALAYLLGPITGILFLVTEKTNSFVRFHAMQSTILGVCWIVFRVGLRVMIGVIPVLGWLLWMLILVVLGFGGLILWLLLMWNAFQGKEWELPIIGPLARKQLSGAA
jgi:uncharacterized membrane protein